MRTFLIPLSSSEFFSSRKSPNRVSQEIAQFEIKVGEKKVKTHNSLSDIMPENNRSLSVYHTFLTPNGDGVELKKGCEIIFALPILCSFNFIPFAFKPSGASALIGRNVGKLVFCAMKKNRARNVEIILFN